ncbi:hypothetical protein CAFE_07080 [Caprobacter fermentans]|uniref:Uncharacterized protein n=1 Tax=Caproicibacter fermentans TaxID=2576756 RepID=A0A6N8HX06_9FIRM|nr:hypothetical protein [Caproicibacter fermentans]MVB10037.1 hypothetical protein [Caproicibacter fermentans]OCN02568.1 hypothetical protein A7X67_05440 [Clostridium sp. W14A]QNK42015.1 hypothetical protein HCR03_07235 [Caproicibacter fermentans]
MKKLGLASICLAFLLFCTACSGKAGVVSPAENGSQPGTSSSSSAAEVPQDNLHWTNSGIKDGPEDGPGYSVYSKVGYRKASAVFCLSRAKTNLDRKSDGKFINAYAFLGIDVYRGGTQWTNCVDAGLLRSGNGGKWHACANRYLADPDESKWWESSVNLDETHDYRLVLDSSQKDEQITLRVFDVTAGDKMVDSKTLGLYYSKADGSTTSYYDCVSMAFPPDICMDPAGRASTDYAEVLKYNTGEGLYFKNAVLKDAALYDASGSHPWTADRTKDRFLWPTKATGIQYPCITLQSVRKDYEETVNIDLNH